jgi:SAM-dependent methyltransferase
MSGKLMRETQAAEAAIVQDMEDRLLAIYENDLDTLREIVSTEIQSFKIRGPLLDVGCGPGFWVQMCKGAGIPSYGVDISSRLLTYGQDRWRLRTLARAEAIALPFPKDYFGWVQCGEVSEHLHPSAGRLMLHEIRRVLLPGGVLRLTTPNRLKYCVPTRHVTTSIRGMLGYPSDPAHMKEYWAWELRSLLLDEGFQVRNSRFVGPNRWKAPIFAPGIELFAVWAG